eukprot:6224166-Pyramimonas_sp.AAC.2
MNARSSLVSRGPRCFLVSKCLVPPVVHFDRVRCRVRAHSLSCNFTSPREGIIPVPRGRMHPKTSVPIALHPFCWDPDRD